MKTIVLLLITLLYFNIYCDEEIKCLEYLMICDKIEKYCDQPPEKRTKNLDCIDKMAQCIITRKYCAPYLKGESI